MKCGKNFLPIWVLPLSRKLLECIIPGQIHSSVQQNILSGRQMGFMKGISTRTTHAHLLFIWTFCKDLWYSLFSLSLLHMCTARMLWISPATMMLLLLIPISQVESMTLLRRQLYEKTVLSSQCSFTNIAYIMWCVTHCCTVGSDGTGWGGMGWDGKLPNMMQLGVMQGGVLWSGEVLSGLI